MSDKIKEMYERGTDLFNRGNYVEAEGLLKEVIGHSPEYADVQNKLGIISHHDGHLKEAAEFFEAAIRLNPRYTEALMNLSITYNDMGEIEKAAKLFKKLKEDAPSGMDDLDPFVAGKLANEHFKIGNLYMDFNRFEDAIDEYRKALKLRPGLADIHTKLGVALREKNLYNEAVSELTKAKKSNPNYGPAWVQLGLTYYMQGLTGQAFQEWEDALKQLPDLKEAAMFLDLFGKGGQGASS
jgi:tetratricopeptide (TPR) repeat protein